MSNVDLEFREGENWRIIFTAHNVDGSVKPLVSGVTVDFVVRSAEGIKIEKSIGDGIQVTDASGGVAQILVEVPEQISAGMVPGGLYAYSIRVVAGADVSIQSEGLFSVKKSSFTSNPDPLMMGFRARFKEFSEIDSSVISIALSDASTIVAREGFPASEVTTATLFLAAHLLQLRKVSASEYESGGEAATGAVKSITVEDRSVSFETGSKSSSSSSKYELGTTGYGMEFLKMLRRRTVYLDRA